MVMVYLMCAGLGALVLLVHSVMGIFGGDYWDGELPDSQGPFGLLSFRALVAAACAFGVGGMIGRSLDLVEPYPFLIGCGTGLLSAVLITFLVRSMWRMDESGNVSFEQAVGMIATVYVSLSAGGLGKVSLDMQGRTVEFDAMSASGELPTGTKVKILRLIDSHTVEVERA